MAGTEQNTTLTLRDYWHVVWLRRRWVVAITLVCALLAFGRAITQPTIYAASAQMMYAPPANVSTATSGYSGDLGRLSYEVQNVLNTVGSPAVAQRAASLLDTADRARPYSVSATTLGSSASATATAVQDVVAIEATSGSAQAAANVANAYSKAIIELRKEREQQSWKSAQQIIQSQLDVYDTADARKTGEYAVLQQQLRDLQIAEASANGDFEIIVPADPPTSRSAPKPVKSAIFGFIVGLFLGVITAFVVDQFDTRVRSADEAVSILNLPLWGQVRKLSGSAASRERLAVLGEANSPAAEAIRKLRGSFEFANVDGEVKSLFITSALQSEGKSTVVCNFALALSEAGHRVVLVDGDLRRPRVHTYLDLPNGKGLSTVLTGRTSLDDTLHSRSAGRRVVTMTFGGSGEAVADAGQHALSVLTSGPIPPNPGELIASKSFATLVSRLESEFDIVVIDAPALLAVGDTAAMAHCVDGLVFLVDVTRAKRPILSAAAAQIAQMPCRKLGLVAVSKDVLFRYGQHYRYEASEGTVFDAAPSLTAGSSKGRA